MIVPDTITSLPSFSLPMREPLTQGPSKESPVDYTLNISEAAQQKIDQLQQGIASLQQAVTQSRQAMRGAAQERVSYIKEYLKILLRMSSPGDRGAAAEAARLAREIKSATAEFRSGILNGEEAGAGVRSEIAGFAGVAGDALNIAQGLIESYLRKRKTKQNGDSDLENEVSDAASSIREMINS